MELPSEGDPSFVVDPRALDDDGNRVGNHFFPRDVNYGINDLQREEAMLS